MQRPGEAAPDPDQPAEQRRQVHRGGLDHRDVPARAARTVAIAVADTGIGIPDQLGAGLRGVPPGRQQQHPAVRRHRPRPVDQPAARAAPGRRHHAARARSGAGSTLHAHACRCAMRGALPGAPEQRAGRRRRPPRSSSRARARRARAAAGWSLRSTTTRTSSSCCKENLARGGLPGGRAPRDGEEGLQARARAQAERDHPRHRHAATRTAGRSCTSSRPIPRPATSRSSAARVVDQKNLGYRLGAADYLMKPFERETCSRRCSASPPHCRRLLVVDDDPHVADLVRQSLEGEPYQIDAAADGREALEAIAERPPDVDPARPADAAHGRLRACSPAAAGPGRRDIPVIVLTAKTLTRRGDAPCSSEHALAVIREAARSIATR